MENNELQKIWKTFDTEINQKSKDELNVLLTSKAKQTINKFLIIIIFSIIVSSGLIIWLFIASINRIDDLIYLLNNIILGIVTVIALLSGLVSWFKLQNKESNQPLKIWLEERIKVLSKSYRNKFKNLHIFLIPFIYILITVSIHVYFEYKPFLEVFKNEESIYGLLIGTAIGLFVAFYIAKKIRKHQLENLEFLKDLLGRLCNVR